MPPDHPTFDAALRLGLSCLLVLPLGWEREEHARSAGLRTYPLLSAGVCGFLLLGQRAAGGLSGQADIFYGVLNGIGFVGSGAILKTEDGAAGLSSAVSLWVAGAIGASVAFGATLIAAALALLSTLALSAPTLIERWRGRS